MLKIISLSILYMISVSNLYAFDEYFLTLRNEKVNLRQGPSFKYPVKLYYKKIFTCFNSRQI